MAANLVLHAPDHVPQVPRAWEALNRARAEAAANAHANRDPLRCPWAPVDALVGPMAVGRVTMLTAGTGSGKSTVALNWVTQGLLFCGEPFCYLGTEMSAAELWRTWAASLEGVPPGVATADAWDQLQDRHLRRIDAIRRLWDGPDVARLTTAGEVREAVLATERRLQDQYGDTAAWFLDAERPSVADVAAALWAASAAAVRLVVLDHLGRVEAGDTYGEKKRSAEHLKGVAREAGVHLLVTVQQNRDVRKGNHLSAFQPPQLVGLEGGGYVEHNAYTVLGAWRPIRTPRDGEDADDFAALRRSAERGDIEPRHVLEPGTVALALLKHRGPPPDVSVGDRCQLRIHHGRVQA